MKASEEMLTRLLEGEEKRFVIPVYQRPYSWKKSNCELLFKDLLNLLHRNDEATHFFGSIVYVVWNTGKWNEYIIIDGQQRITTVSLLLLAIRNYILEKQLDIAIYPNQITRYLIDEFTNREKKLKLKLVQGDDDAYDRLIEEAEPISNNNITVNYRYFYEVLSTLSKEEIEGLYSAIKKLIIVNISLDPHNGDDPQLIFESLNSTGLDLEEADKIRNYVLMKMPSLQQERIYKNYWGKLESKVSKEDINKFIRYYLAVKTRELANENRLYFAFKSYREKNNNLKIEDILGDMLIYADFYDKIRNSKISDKASYLNIIARINKLEVNTVTPLLFDLLYAKQQSLLTKEELTESISIIESYIARRIICGLPASALNKIFVSMGAEIQRYIDKNGATFMDALKYSILSKTGKSRFPTDHDFAEKFITYELYNAKPNTRKYFLERLENYKNRERIAVEEQIDNGELTIEHIMPQTLTKEWKESLGDNWELIHSKYIDTVGNLTLTAYNSDYSNLSFNRKKNLADKGFDYSKLSLNAYIKTCNEWNEKQIVTRATKLYSWAEQIWQTPKTSFVPNVIEEWVTLDDELDFTNKTVVKIYLLGDEIACNNVTDAYNKVNETLYLLDPVLYANIENNYHSEKSSNLRSPYELSTTMFVETNLSSQHKINILRELFDSFKIDYSDLKFLVRPKQKNVEVLNLFDEKTFSNVTAGELAFHMFSYLLKNNKISQTEIDKLITKEFARTTFRRVSYPVLAFSRDANRGDSKKYRYYKTPVNVNGKDIFICSQWFEESRADLTRYFQSKV